MDAGFRVAMETLDLFRPSVGAFAVGMAQAALDAAVAHASRREAFGKPLRSCRRSDTSSPRSPQVQAARLLVYEAAVVLRRRRAARPAGFGNGQAVRDGDGPAGRRRRHPGPRREGAREGHLLEHLYREVRAPRIYEGASEVQREIIARELFKETV